MYICDDNFFNLIEFKNKFIPIRMYIHIYLFIYVFILFIKCFIIK